jgi:hypothetical protein
LRRHHGCRAPHCSRPAPEHPGAPSSRAPLNQTIFDKACSLRSPRQRSFSHPREKTIDRPG